MREVQEQVESWCEKNSEPIVITGEVMGCDIEFEVAKVPLGHCYQRAKLLHLLEPKTYPTILLGPWDLFTKMVEHFGNMDRDMSI